MKNILMLIAAIIALSSCSRSRKDLVKTDYKQKKDSSATTVEQIVTTTTVDTILYTPVKVDSADVKVVELLGSEVVVIDNDVQQVTARIDAVTGKINIKATAKEQKMIAKAEVIKVENRTTDVRVKEKRKGEQKAVEKKRAKLNSLALLGISIALIIIYIIYRIARRYFSMF